jgi:hypothetical protein
MTRRRPQARAGGAGPLQQPDSPETSRQTPSDDPAVDYDITRAFFRTLLTR